jgi:UDP-N-acetylmuramoyl-tripeptide--D-alanyl-D-alanine ligase
MSIDEIKVALHNLKSVEHRLQKLEVNGKVIIDDSFNGNLEGMLEAVRISSTYEKRKIIITPGLVESTEFANKTLAKAIDEVFDICIVTGTLNKKVLSANISKAEVIILENKNDLEHCLLENTQIGDLILFANDAPNFI